MDGYGYGYGYRKQTTSETDNILHIRIIIYN